MIQQPISVEPIPSPPRKPVLLVVDDNDAIRKLLNVAMQRQGFDVWLAASGEEAIEISRHQTQIDLVLLDLQMPGLDGAQTLARLRETRRDLPCCFMTGAGDLYDEADLLDAGAVCVFPKPLDVPYLARILRQLLHAPSRYSQPAA